MNLADVLATGALLAPWPVLVDGRAIPGNGLPESETCVRKCGEARLCANSADPGENLCPHGMTFFRWAVGAAEVTVYGVRGHSNPTKLNRYTRGGLKGRSAGAAEVWTWTQRLGSLLALVDREFATRQSEMLDPLHDPMRLAKQVNTIANRLVQMHSQGATFDQQIENASIELKTLVKASDLLSDSFDLLAIYFNPEAATFGRQSATNLHGLITKLIAIFRIDDGGVTKTNTRIFLNGSCYRNVFVHESFKLIPFALLTNAVKYVMQGNIDVVVEDRRQFVELSVASTGPLIEDSERELIFLKRGRGQWATKLVEGKGVGLYLANIIARAHGTTISVSSSRTGAVIDGIPLARNRFTLNIPATLPHD